jgi:hypothetical protein
MLEDVDDLTHYMQAVSRQRERIAELERRNVLLFTAAKEVLVSAADAALAYNRLNGGGDPVRLAVTVESLRQLAAACDGQQPAPAGEEGTP